ILRQFYFSTWQWLLYNKLLTSKSSEIAAIAEKSVKETRYHVKWSREWVLRLGDGTAESHQRMLAAMQSLEPWISEIFIPGDFEYESDSEGIGPLPEIFRDEWFGRVNEILREATLPTLSSDSKTMPILSGKKGIHSEHLGYLLAEMQFLQRAYPGSTW